MLAAATALAVPAVALAASHDYGGKLGPPGANIELTLTVKPKQHPAKKVTRFEWNNVPTQCGTNGTSATTGIFHKKMTVKDGSFHRTVHLNSGRETVTVNGTFTDKGQKAHGTLRVTGPIPGCSKSDTGVVAWTVHRHQ
jgi:hypothetical protein